MTAIIKAEAETSRESYLALIERLPLRVIQSKAQHVAALSLINELMGKGDQTRNTGEDDYLRVLVRLVSDYETQIFHRKSMSPLVALRGLMELNDLHPKDLYETLGDRSQTSLVLTGKRALSLAQIGRLAARFKVSPAIFMERPRRSNGKVRRPGGARSLSRK